MDIFLAMALKPILALIVFGLFIRPIAYLLYKIIPEGKIKRVLFWRY
jgi:hypothetical protein